MQLALIKPGSCDLREFTQNKGMERGGMMFKGNTVTQVGLLLVLNTGALSFRLS